MIRSSSNSENSTEALWDQPSFSFFWACSQNFLISPCTQKNIKQIKNESDVSTKHRKLCWPVLHFFIDTRKKMTTVSQTLQWLSCSNSKFLLHSAGEIWKHDEFDLWPFQADFTLTQLFKTKAVTTLLFIRRTESLKSHLWDPNGFEHFSQKASVVKDPQISWNNLVLQHGSSRNIYPVTMIGYDDDSTLMNKTINEWKTDRNVTYSCNLCSKSKVIVKKYSWVALTGWWPVQGVSHLPPCGISSMETVESG